MAYTQTDSTYPKAEPDEPQGGVYRELTALDSAIEQAGNYVSSLATRLVAVLSASEPSTKPEQNIHEASNTPLQGTVGQRLADVRELNSRLASLLERVDI